VVAGGLWGGGRGEWLSFLPLLARHGFASPFVEL